MSIAFHRAGVMVAGAVLLSSVFAGDRISGEIAFEIQTDSVISADSEESEFTSAQAAIESSVSLALASRLKLNTEFVFEAVTPEDNGSSEPGGDRFFKDQGLYVQQLFFEWSDDAWSVHAGKFDPAFGIPWDSASGLYSDDFAGDYEITEQLGAGISVPLDSGEEGTVSLSIDAFMVDTSGLSSCVAAKCVRPRRSDGGAGNTSWPQSFSVAVGAGALPALGGLGFQAGILHRADGDDGPDDELGLAIALTHTLEIEGGSAVEWTVEGARLNNFEGGADDVTFLTAGFAYLRGPWNAAAAGAVRNTGTEQGEYTRDTLFQLSAGYDFEAGFSVEVGWRYSDVEHETSQTIGTVIAYGVEF